MCDVKLVRGLMVVQMMMTLLVTTKTTLERKIPAIRDQNYDSLMTNLTTIKIMMMKLIRLIISKILIIMVELKILLKSHLVE